jgi:GTPase SAR1 family protein
MKMFLPVSNHYFSLLQILCYSVDNPDSFTNIENEIWTEVKERFPDIPIILVANKSDLIREEEQQTYKR